MQPERSRDRPPEALSAATLWPFAVSVFLPGVALVLFLAFAPMGRSLVGSLLQLGRPAKTVDDRLAEFGAPARERWRARFAAVGGSYPPTEVAFLALKEERTLEVYAPVDDPRSPWRRIASFPILGASGGVGPKLREGDLQVPEGIYRIESLHPDSLYHAALRLDYPNEFDRSMAGRDGRADSGSRLGGDIMIHGRDRSIGCLAMGDPAIEELFTLTADAGADVVRVVIAPWDLRTRAAPDPTTIDETARPWAPELYKAISRVKAQLPREDPPVP